MSFHNLAMPVSPMTTYVTQGPFYAVQPQINSISPVYFCVVPNMMYCQTPQIPLSQISLPQSAFQTSQDFNKRHPQQNFRAIDQEMMAQNSNSLMDISKRSQSYQTINQNNTDYSLNNIDLAQNTQNTINSNSKLSKIQQVPEKKQDHLTQSSSTQEFKQIDAVLDQKKGVKQEMPDQLQQQEVESDFDPNESNSADRERRGKGHLWSPQELKRLVNLYQNTDGNWKQIVQRMEGRSISQCSQKFRKIMKDKYKKKKNKWTEDEDELLMRGVEKYGKDWLKIAEELGDRNCKQVRDRYINKLDPTLTDRAWTEAEDQQLLDLYQQQGKKWTLFSKILKGRSENQVKNRFYYRIKKKFLKNQAAQKIVIDQ